jgi:hypothetical protein
MARARSQSGGAERDGSRRSAAGVRAWATRWRPHARAVSGAAVRRCIRRVGPRTVRPASPRLKDAVGAASRSGYARSLTRGPLTGLGRGYGQGLRPRPEWRGPHPDVRSVNGAQSQSYARSRHRRDRQERPLMPRVAPLPMSVLRVGPALTEAEFPGGRLREGRAATATPMSSATAAGFGYGWLASRRTALARTSVPLAQASGLEYSRGVWLMPPLSPATKTIAVEQIAAISWASCPAPDMART